jgi:predicted glycoside hydrolase/deacetylase ChbG (UPF0249 family)
VDITFEFEGQFAESDRSYRPGADRLSESAVRLVVNADDFGMTPAISRGIIRAHREGIVTSTSVLGNCADPPVVKRLLTEVPDLGVGIHLTLLDGEPVAPSASVPSLMDGSGRRFRSRGVDFFTSWIKGEIQTSEIEMEFDAQVSRFRDLGVTPDHLDTHRHLGFVPAVGQAMEAVARRHGIAGIRSVVEKPTLNWIAEPMRGLEAGLLAGLAFLTHRKMGSLRHGPQSWGFVEIGHLDEVRIMEIIGRMASGPHELICHPADPDDQAAPAADGGRYRRADELAALTSARIRNALHRRGITLCRWKDLV